jgi:hypothetical protein
LSESLIRSFTFPPLHLSVTITTTTPSSQRPIRVHNQDTTCKGIPAQAKIDILTAPVYQPLQCRRYWSMTTPVHTISTFRRQLQPLLELSTTPQPSRKRLHTHRAFHATSSTSATSGLSPNSPQATRRRLLSQKPLPHQCTTSPTHGHLLHQSISSAGSSIPGRCCHTGAKTAGRAWYSYEIWPPR